MLRWESPCNLSGQFLGIRMLSENDEPQLELPLALPARQASSLVPAILLLGLIGGGVFAATDSDSKSTAKIPSRPEDLSANVVTVVSPEDRAGVASAVAALKVAPSQRAEIEQAVIDRRQRLGWIVFTDSMDAGRGGAGRWRSDRRHRGPERTTRRHRHDADAHPAAR
jgi:hypothetical protein